ncbi:MAG: hypothetical protein WDZ94_05110 [Patescibacteria group bacterium]
MFFFKLKLLFSLMLFLSALAWEYFVTVRTVVLYSVVTIVVCWSFLTTITSFQTTQSTILYPVVLQATPEENQQLLTEDEIRELLQTYHLALEVQPHHRDVLINTALLYQALGEVEHSQKYWQQALLLDPNHSIFTQEL